MHGLGTIINTVAVILGGLIGMVFKNGLKKRFQDILMQACGVAVMFIGLSGTLQGLFKVTGGKIETQGTMLLIFSLVLGGLLGELLNIEHGLDMLGEKLKSMVKASGDNRFVEGFVSTSLIICIGAMAIVGAMEDGLTGDISMLAAKSVLDFVIVMVLAATYGLGAVFSALPIFVYQGAITLIAMFAGTVISDVLIAELSYVGSALIFCVGVNTSFGKLFKVGNLLPALLVPIVYEILRPLIPIF